MSESAESKSCNDERSNDFRARRDARRRNILENSKSRLEKLNGRKEQNKSSYDGISQPKTPIIYPDPEIHLPDDNDYFTLGGHTNFATTRTTTGQEQFEIFNQFSQMQMPGGQFREQKTSSRSNKLINSKLHLVLISMLTYVLFVTGNEKYVSYSVFFPLLVWEIIEVLFVKNLEKQSASLLMVPLMIAGIPSNYILPSLKVIETLNKVFKDVGVFVFFFVLTHLIFSCFAKEFIDLSVSLSMSMSTNSDFDPVIDMENVFESSVQAN